MAVRDAWEDVSCTNDTRAHGDLPRFAGWWGHDEKTRFQMGPDFHPMEGAEGWQLSNPPVLALAPAARIDGDFFRSWDGALRAKSVSLTGYLEFLLRTKWSSEFSIITPAEETRRGAQLSVRLSRRGREICDRLRL